MRPNYKAAKTSKVMINVYLIDIMILQLRSTHA